MPERRSLIHHLRFLLLSLLSAAFLRQTVDACSPLPGIPVGPFFFVFPGSPEAPVIQTTPENPNVLRGRVELFRGDTFEPYDAVAVTIDLASGRVTPGEWEFTQSPPPVLVDDPTGGYEFRIISPNQFALASPDGVATTYTLPVANTVMVNPADGVYFFVSTEFNIAYILYEAGTLGQTADGTQLDDSTTPAYVSIDLTTNTVLASGTFEAPRGVVVFRPGAFQSLETVYGLPVPAASLGALDSCGGTGWIRYTREGTVESMARFDPGRVQAVVDPEALTAYRMIQDNQVIFEGDDEPTRYVQSFEVQHVNMVTGEVLATIPLNTEDMWALAEGVEPPFIPQPTPNIVPFPPVSNPPTPRPQAPTGGTGGGMLTPTNPPTDSPVVVPTDPPIQIFIPAPPTDAPVVAPTEAPINIFIPAPPTDAPVAAPTEAPINIFIPAPPTSPPTRGSGFGGDSFTPAPITPTTPRIDPTAAPIFPSVPQQCSANAACSQLAGDCCPTVDSVLLACCGMGEVSLTCQENPKCNELGLVDACCPAPKGVYLDCCSVVPDECGQPGSTCLVVSALEYRDEQLRSASVSGVAASSRRAFVGLLLEIVSVWMLLMV